MVSYVLFSFRMERAAYSFHRVCSVVAVVVYFFSLHDCAIMGEVDISEYRYVDMQTSRQVNM